MAGTYTYDDFLTAAQNANMLNTFSPEDLTITQRNPEFGLSMLKLQQDAGKATTSEQKLLAQEAVNQLRKTYNALPTTTAANTEMTAGSAPATPVTADGTASSAVPQTVPGYSYGGENAYQKALEGVTGFNPYSYDYQQDPTYGAMRDQYLSDNQFMEDRTLGNPAVSSSGIPSYAGAAAGQSANYYAGKLNDIIPQLEQDAYERYLKDFQMANSRFEAAAGDKAMDYAQWQKQQELELAAIQQKFANDTILHQQFGQAAPVLPDLSRLGTGTSMTPEAVETATPAETSNPETNAAEGTVPTEPLAPVYTYGKQNEYQAALDAVLNNPAFSYTIANDPQYASLRKSYMREGQRANEDALAKASAGSMGIPSSYAIRQAADAGNAYNEQLMSAIPGLQENAYGRYLNDFQNRVGTLGQLSADRETDYNQWLQNYQLDQKVKQQNFDNAVALYQITRQLTPEIAAVLGIPYVAPVASYDNTSWGPASPVDNSHNGMVESAFKTYQGVIARGGSEAEARKKTAEIAGNWYQAHGKWA